MPIQEMERQTAYAADPSKKAMKGLIAFAEQMLKLNGVIYVKLTTMHIEET